MMNNKLFAIAGLGFALAIVGCSSQEAAAAGGDAGQPAASVAAAPEGNVVEVKMITDGAVNRFEPENVAVRRGDVVRFVLVSGVHNVSFPAASNAGVQDLPATSAFLQAPGQTHDVAVDLPAGDYTFQCDPHAMLGMVGTLIVK
jgi:plastocyanin